MDEPHVKRRNNALTQHEAARLMGWLESNRQKAATDTARKLADLASMALGITITESNVGSARRALGITKPAPAAKIEDQRVLVLAAALLALYRQMHLEPPALLVGMVVPPRRFEADVQPRLVGIGA